MHESSAAPKWLRVVNTILAGWVGFCLPGMLLSWGMFVWQMLRPDAAAGWGENMSLMTVAMVAALGVGIVLGGGLAWLRWRGSSHSNARREVFLSVCLVILSLVVLVQPGVFPQM